jgi:hypothetical protein
MEMNEFGTDDQPTVTLVIALASLNIIPNKLRRLCALPPARLSLLLK